MKPPILIGVGIGIVILVAGLLAPLLQSSARTKAVEAQQKATLAARELDRYSVALRRAGELAAPAEMKAKDAELKAAVQAASEPLNAISTQYSTLSRSAQELARRSGLPAPTLPPFGPDEAGVQRAITAFEAALKENEALLKTAIADATAAVGIDAAALGVPQALGMAEYVRAAGLLADAENARSKQGAAQARLLDVGAEWKAAQGYLDYYRGLDSTPILARLRSDLEDIAARRTAATAAATALATQVDAQKKALEQAERALAEKQKQLRDVETKGFKAGQDEGPDGFLAFRDRFGELSQGVRDLQQKVQELRYGVLRDAQLVGDDWAADEVQGGEALVGLEELERRLTTAQERARRLDGANVSLEGQVKYLTEAGQQTQGDAARYQERLTQLDTAQKETVAEIKKLVTDAFNKETEALRAAENAVRAFGQAQRAADAWIRAATDLQRENDQTRKNERLLLATKDVYLAQVPRTAEASARVLVGRIQVQRICAARRLIEDMRLFGEMYTDPRFSFDAATFQTQMEEAQAAGGETLDRAAELYNTVSEKLGSQPTAWVPLAALAATYDLQSQIDPAQSGVYLAKAVEAIQKAVEKREQSPYVQPFVLYRDHLLAVANPPTELKKEGPGQATPEKAEDEDFFKDEE